MFSPAMFLGSDTLCKGSVDHPPGGPPRGSSPGTGGSRPSSCRTSAARRPCWIWGAGRRRRTSGPRGTSGSPRCSFWRSSWHILWNRVRWESFVWITLEQLLCSIGHWDTSLWSGSSPARSPFSCHLWRRPTAPGSPRWTWWRRSCPSPRSPSAQTCSPSSQPLSCCEAGRRCSNSSSHIPPHGDPPGGTTPLDRGQCQGNIWEPSWGRFRKYFSFSRYEWRFLEGIMTRNIVP